MKVLLLSTSNSRNAGGLYATVQSLGNTLLQMKGIYPIVLGFHDEYSNQDILNYSPLEITEYHIIGPAGVGLSFDLNKNIKKIKPELIHIQGSWLYSSYVNFKYSKKNKTPYIISPHGMLDPWIMKNRPWKKKIGLFLYERNHLERADCIHALNEKEFKSLRELGLKNPIAIIPNGISKNSLTKNKHTTKPYIKPTWNKDNRKIVLFLGRIHPKKGLDNLLKAWYHLKDTQKDNWKLIIAGDTNDEKYMSKLKKDIHLLGLNDDVFLIGSQFGKDKELCFQNAETFILPSYSEGMPMSVLEAWSFKLPVLMTEECNLNDGFVSKAAIKISPETSGILNGLESLFSLSCAERRKIGLNGFDLVERNYTWEEIAEKMKDTYEWVLNKKRGLPSFIKID